MFDVAPSFTRLAVRPERILTLLHSMNAVAVKVPGYPLSPAMAYVAGWDNEDGTASAVLYLLYTGSRRAVAYLPRPRAFPLTELPAVVQEAVDFLESMGFMLDDARFRALEPEQQEALMERMPLFHADLVDAAEDAGEELPEIEVLEVTDGEAEPTPPAQPSERAQAIGRMLMSF